jgi:hypothetical protein
VDLRYNPIGQPTGRDDFPGFVARSRANPGAELRDPAAWNQGWMDTRARLSSTADDIKPFHRWSNDGPGCA